MTPILILKYETIPTVKHPQHGSVGGAYLNCYVRAEDLNAAEQIAMSEMPDEWKIVAMTDEAVIAPSDDPDHPGRQYIEQARIDGSVYVFFTWPANADDAQDG